MIIEEWSYITKTINCDILVLDMRILDTRVQNNLIGKFISDIVLQILSFVAENERTNIKKRQAEGIKIAHEKGVKFGRPAIKLPKNFQNVFKEYKEKNISIYDALNILNISRTSFFKYYRIYRNET